MNYSSGNISLLGCEGENVARDLVVGNCHMIKTGPKISVSMAVTILKSGRLIPLLEVLLKVARSSIEQFRLTSVMWFLGASTSSLRGQYGACIYPTNDCL